MNGSQQVTAQRQHESARVLGRQLARELTAEEIEAVSGGMYKTHDSSGGTQCIYAGNVDDGEAAGAN